MTKQDEAMLTASRVVAEQLSQMLDVHGHEPSARAINLGAWVRATFHIFTLRYVLVPVGVMSVSGYRRVEGGYDVWECRQVHLFGVRVARWVVAGSARRVPDKVKPEVSVEMSNDAVAMEESVVTEEEGA